MESTSRDSSSPPGSKWQIPLVFILGAVLWMVVTWVKWSLLAKRDRKYQMDNDKLEALLKFDSISGKTAAEALRAFHARRAAEERAKVEKAGGRTLIEEIDERRRLREEKEGTEQGQPKVPKYSKEMFEDSGTGVYKEMMAKRAAEEEEEESGRKTGPEKRKRSEKEEVETDDKKSKKGGGLVDPVVNLGVRVSAVKAEKGE